MGQDVEYLQTAFTQLQFAIKLMQAAEDGVVKVEDIDISLTIQDEEGRPMLVLPDRVLACQDELINASQNHVSMAFGAAAIALNRFREGRRVALPGSIDTELEQWVALVYQIRNAFAHDICAPKWNITKPYFARKYAIGRVRADLSQLHGAPFVYADIGGPGALFVLKDYGVARIA